MHPTSTNRHPATACGKVWNWFSHAASTAKKAPFLLAILLITEYVIQILFYFSIKQMMVKLVLRKVVSSTIAHWVYVPNKCIFLIIIDLILGFVNLKYIQEKK